MSTGGPPGHAAARQYSSGRNKPLRSQSETMGNHGADEGSSKAGGFLGKLKSVITTGDSGKKANVAAAPQSATTYAEMSESHAKGGILDAMRSGRRGQSLDENSRSDETKNVTGEGMVQTMGSSSGYR